jgi:transposase InsO family protein
MELPEVWKQLEVSEATYHRWRNQFRGMKADDVKRLKELEAENARLKRIVADQVLEVAALREVSKETGEPVAPAPGGPDAPGPPWPVGAAGVPDRWSASLDAASRADGRSGGRGDACRASAVLPPAAEVGVPSSASAPARSGLVGESQAHAAAVARGGPQGPAEAPQAPACRRIDRTPGDRLRAERPDHVRAFDFQFDVTEDGRAVKLLYVVDEFTREALAMEAERRIDADKVVDVLDRLVAERSGSPEFVRCDNGPEMTSHALRDWCRFSRTGTAFIEPGSPWENPFVESFNSRVRDELLAVEVFTCLAEAKVMIEDYRQDYNRCRPHRAHGMMTPAAFAIGWREARLAAAPASAELRRRYASAPFDAGGSLTLRKPTTHRLSQQVDR